MILRNKPSVGIGTRVLHFLIDTLLVFILAFVAYQVHKWYVYYYRVPLYNFGWFFFTAVFVFYFVLEGFFAKTPGKWFTKSSVIGLNGLRANWQNIFIRSISRLILIDMFFIPFLDKTLHDYLSKTIVVED